MPSHLTPSPRPPWPDDLKAEAQYANVHLHVRSAPIAPIAPIAPTLADVITKGIAGRGMTRQPSRRSAIPVSQLPCAGGDVVPSERVDTSRRVT